MIIKNLDIEKYISGVKVLIGQKDIKALNGQVLTLADDLKVKSIIDINCDIKNIIENGEKVYLPFVSGFDSYVRCINGTEFDLDEGLEPEWIEGVGYIDSAIRLIDTGDFTISAKNIAGFIAKKVDEGYQIDIAEYLLGDEGVSIVKNTGLLGIEIKEFLEN